MQFKVPQNIDMADRIVGPLTLIQFLYVLVGGIIDYALFNSVAPTHFTLFISIALPVTLFSLALAFLKIQDQPFPKFVVAFVVYLFRPKMRLWQKAGIDPELIIMPEKVEKKAASTTKVIKKAEIDRLTQILDTGGQVPPDEQAIAVAQQVRQQKRPLGHPIAKKRPMLDMQRKPRPHAPLPAKQAHK